MSKAMGPIQKAIYRKLMSDFTLRNLFKGEEKAFELENMVSTDNLKYEMEYPEYSYWVPTAEFVLKVDGQDPAEPYTLDVATGTVTFEEARERNVAISGTCFVVRIYDEVPKDCDYPYVDIGEFDCNQDNVYGKNGEEVFNTLHVYTGPKRKSSYNMGNKDIQELGAAIVSCLDGQALTIDGYNWTDTQFDFSTVYKEDEYRHMPIRMKIWVREQ